MLHATSPPSYGKGQVISHSFSERLLLLFGGKKSGHFTDMLFVSESHSCTCAQSYRIGPKIWKRCIPVRMMHEFRPQSELQPRMWPPCEEKSASQAYIRPGGRETAVIYPSERKPQIPFVVNADFIAQGSNGRTLEHIQRNGSSDIFVTSERIKPDTYTLTGRRVEPAVFR